MRTVFVSVLASVSVLLATALVACGGGDTDPAGQSPADTVEPAGDEGGGTDPGGVDTPGIPEDTPTPPAEDVSGDTPPEGCGNGVCDEDEDPCSCHKDCVPKGKEAGEVGDPCCDPTDCLQPAGVCELAPCEGLTCGEVVEILPCCGNDVCEASELDGNCPGDCWCGNDVCEADETAESCPNDCGEGPPCKAEGEWCDSGDGVCDCCADLVLVTANAGVLNGQCEPLDCGSYGICTQCGDGVCGIGETFCTCPDDCKDTCVGMGGVTVGEGGCCEGNPFVKSLPLSTDPGCVLHVCTVCGGGSTCDYGETPENCPDDCAQ